MNWNGRCGRRARALVLGAMAWAVAGGGGALSPSAAQTKPPAQKVAASAEALEKCRDEAEQFYEEGRIKECLERTEAALAMGRELFGQKDDPKIATDLNLSGFCLDALGRYPEGLPRYEAGLAMRRRLAGGKDDDLVATSLGNVAICLTALGRAEEALPKYQEALAIFKRLAGDKDSADVAKGTNDVAFCLLDLGRYNEALRDCNAALEMRRRLFGKEDHPDVAEGLNNVAYCLQTMGRLSEALPVYEQALAMNQRLHSGKDHADLATAINNLAFCLGAMGRYPEAQPRYEEALAMRIRLHEGEDHPEIADSINNLAMAYSSDGRYGEALPKFQAALAMWQRIFGMADHPRVATGLNNVAFSLARLGRTAEALEQYQQALDMRLRLYKEQDQPDIADSLANTALVMLELGRTAEALPRFEKALAIDQKIYGEEDHPSVAMALNNIAYCLSQSGRTDEALPQYEKALAMQVRIFGKVDHPDVAGTLINIGGCYETLGRSAQALSLYETALGMERRLGTPMLSATASLVGNIHMALGDAPQAEAAFAEAIKAMEGTRLKLGGDDQDRLTFISMERRKLDPFALMVQLQLEQHQVAKAINYSEEGRSLGLLDLLERGNKLAGGDVLEPVLQKARESGDARQVALIVDARKAKLAAEGTVGSVSAEISLARRRADLSELERGTLIEKLQKELTAAQDRQRSTSRMVQNLAKDLVSTDFKPADLGAMQKMLKAGEYLLEYTVTGDWAAVMLVPSAADGKEELRAFTLKWADGSAVKAADLEEKVSGYLQNIQMEGAAVRGVGRLPATRPGGVGDATEKGHALFEALIPAQVWAAIGKGKQVYVVPDGALHRLPFETLLVEAPAQGAAVAQRHYWLDDGPAIAYGPSATVLVNRAKAREDQRQREAGGSKPVRELALLGDPVFERSLVKPLAIPEKGVLVGAVEPGSLAEEIGLSRGAVVVSYGAIATESVTGFDDALDKLMGQQRRGTLKDVPKLVFWRDGQMLEHVADPARKLGVGLLELTPESLAAQKARGIEPTDAMTTRSGYLTRYGPLKALPGTRAEVLSIYQSVMGKAFSATATGDAQVSVLLGEDATRPKLVAAAAGARYVHLATHGLVESGERALYSSLALTQPKVPTPEDIGFLTLQDLFDHWWGKLSATELVVLSACDSQGLDSQAGNLQSGEGAFGLPWGFMYAGSPAVIASLWEVDDASTAEMMGGLYGRMGKGGTKLEAFTSVRKELRKKRPEPFFWAPFIYLGDPR